MQVTKLFGHVRMIPSYSEAMLMDPAPPAYPVDCGGPAPPYDDASAGPSPPSPWPSPPRTVMTVFRTCSPDYAAPAADAVRYVESGPHAYPPSYEEALGYPLFELSADGDVAPPTQPRPQPGQTRPQPTQPRPQPAQTRPQLLPPPPQPRATTAAITFETSL